LLEVEGSDWFKVLESGSPESSLDIESVNAKTLRVSTNNNQISVFCARQINTKERLELVIVGCRDPIESHLPMDYYINKYQEDYLLILPWGVGKWLGGRGELVSSLINETSSLVLGDNGGRPSLWSNVPQFEKAKHIGMPILAGSDPLPVSSFSKRAGSYGCIFEGEITDCDDWISIVRNSRPQVDSYGKLSSAYRFFIDQVELRLRKYV